jgi:hypothetical protein
MAFYYHKRVPIERLNCMQFERRIAQKESGSFDGHFAIPLI